MWLFKYLLMTFKDKINVKGKNVFWNHKMDVWRESALMHLALKMEGEGTWELETTKREMPNSLNK